MEKLYSLHDTFLQLVRLGIGNTSSVTLPNDVDWSAMRSLAERHGLSAVILEGLNKCHIESTDNLSFTNCSTVTNMSQMLRLEWIGDVLQNYEARYTQYEKAIGSLAGWYNKHGFKMMVLKGYACSLDWPKPEHRHCGDIDIWQFGAQKEADKCLAESAENAVIDDSHHHHTVFYWKGFMVENHYDFINVHHHKSHAEFEKILKELGQDDSRFVEVNGEKVYIPSPNLHALFLLKHSAIEFAASGANLRQLLDWGFFVKTHGKEVDWEWLEKVLEHFGMKTLYSIYNAICVGDLGFPIDVFNIAQFDPAMKDRVLNEFLSPEVPNEQPRFVLSRVIWKYRRWKANEWKHNLCYKESMWSAFWSGVWNHILKPSSI